MNLGIAARVAAGAGYSRKGANLEATNRLRGKFPSMKAPPPPRQTPETKLPRTSGPARGSIMTPTKPPMTTGKPTHPFFEKRANRASKKAAAVARWSQPRRT